MTHQAALISDFPMTNTATAFCGPDVLPTMPETWTLPDSP